MFMELAFGQYASLSPVVIFKRFSPLFAGLGYGMIAVSTIVMLYYNLIIGRSFEVTSLKKKSISNTALTPLPSMDIILHVRLPSTGATLGSM